MNFIMLSFVLLSAYFYDHLQSYEEVCLHWFWSEEKIFYYFYFWKPEKIIFIPLFESNAIRNFVKYFYQIIYSYLGICFPLPCYFLLNFIPTCAANVWNFVWIFFFYLLLCDTLSFVTHPSVTYSTFYSLLYMYFALST